MLVSLSSGNYDIVASGQAFLFSKDKDLRIDIQADNGFAFSLILNFIENESVGYTGALKAPVRCFGNHLSEKRKSLFRTDN